jgi:predicted transcriptional regulator
MSASKHNQIRDLLLAAEDGMTANEIAAKMDADPHAIRRALRNTFGVYIDRWTAPKRGQFSAVYMCVPIPEDAPHPTERYLPQTKWQANAQMVL